MIRTNCIRLMAAFLACSPVSAEIEGEVHVRFPLQSAENFPIVVTALDSKGRPLGGVAVALMRLEKGGFTENDVLDPKTPRTDAHGNVTLNCPATPITVDQPGLVLDHAKLIGMITLMHAGFETHTMELEKLFPNPIKIVDATSVPWIRITLEQKRARNQDAEQVEDTDAE